MKEHEHGFPEPGQSKNFMNGRGMELVKTGGMALLIKKGITSIGPNHKCPCGSGKRFKRCCMYKGV